MTAERHPHRLMTAEQARKFFLAGNATLTLKSAKTKLHFTYKVRKPTETSPHFVALLRGPDNETDYSFLGTIFDPTKPIVHSKKSRISTDTMSWKAFQWAWDWIRNGKIPEALEIWHEGKCCRCGRTLTVPESIANGIGPECIKHV